MEESQQSLETTEVPEISAQQHIVTRRFLTDGASMAMLEAGVNRPQLVAELRAFADEIEQGTI